jgi:hypothetical protein
MMMQFRWCQLAASVILGLSLLAMPGAVRAQQVDSMHIAGGSPLLVRMRDGTQGQWRFERQSPESVTLSRREFDGVLIHSVPWAAAERIDVQVSDPPSPRRILVGTVVGAGVGYAVAFIGATHGTCHFDSGDCPQLGWAIAMPAIVAVGGCIGGIEGYLSRHRYWSTVWRASPPPASPSR